MSAETKPPRVLTKGPGLAAAFACSTLLTHLIATSSAFACGNATRVVAEGLFPTMFFMWGAGLIVSVFVIHFDGKRETPLTIRSRAMVVAAIVVMLSGAWTVYYGVTTDYDEWRTWDQTQSGLQAPQGDAGNKVEF